MASAAVAAVETGAAAAVGVERLSDCFAVGALGASFGTDACAHVFSALISHTAGVWTLCAVSMHSLCTQAQVGTGHCNSKHGLGQQQSKAAAQLAGVTGTCPRVLLA